MPGKGKGVLGENIAANYLQQQGYIIRTRNFKSRFGEVDIIAEKDGFLCFTEVKTRGPGSYGRPMEAVTYQKQQRILKTAQYYLLLHKTETELSLWQPRFDCVEIFLDATDQLRHIILTENAF